MNPERARERIARCEAHKREIEKRVSAIRREGAQQGLTHDVIQQRVQAYLGERSYDEWMALYDGIIRLENKRLTPRESRFAQHAQHDWLARLTQRPAITVAVIFLILLAAGAVIAMLGSDAILADESQDLIKSVSIRRGDTGLFLPVLGKPEGERDLRIIPHEGADEIILHDVVLDTEVDLRVEDVAVATTVRGRESLATFAIDPSRISFTEGELTRTARGRQLWKCVDWNYALQQCTGTWALLRELTPGEDYTVAFDQHDPGFAETDLTIINVQSYPIVGGIWEVNFETIGLGDLSIRASNGTTWGASGAGKDLQFLTIMCGDEAVSYEWQNDSIVVRDFSCGEVGSEQSRVFTKGKHVLEFTFGDRVAYAKNYASASGVLMLRDSAGGVSVDAAYPTGTNITWDTSERVDPIYGYQSDTRNITVSTTGIYRISYGVSFSRDTTNTRVEHYGRVLVNGAEATQCWGQGYTRGISSTVYTMATSDCLLNLTAGDEVVLNAGRSSDASLATTTIADRNWFHMQLLPTPDVAMIRDTGGGQSMNSVTGTILDWDTIERLDDTFDFNPTANNITVLEDGLYRITYGVGVNHESNTRYEAFSEVWLNGAVAPTGAATTYVRGSTGARDGYLTSDMLLELQAGDYVQILGGRESPTSVGTAQTLGDETWFHMEKIPASDANVVMLRETGGGQSLDNTVGVDIDFDQVLRNDTDFRIVDSNTVEVQRTGLYRVAYSVYANRANDGSGTRLSNFGKLRVNNVDEPACWSNGYLRGLQGGIWSYNASLFASCLVNLSSGDTLEVRAGRDSGTSIAATALSNKTWWYVQSLDVINEGPNVTALTSPENDSVITSSPADFLFTVDDDQDDTNCTLYGNFSGTWGPNVSTTGVPSDAETNLTTYVEDGLYYWNVLCTDPYSLQDWYAYNYTVTVDAHPPLISNVALNASSINQTQTIKLNLTAVDFFNVTLVNTSLRFPNGTLVNVSLSRASGTLWELLFSTTNQTGLYNFTSIGTRDKNNNTNETSFTDLAFTVTLSPPASFVLLAPPNGSVRRVIRPNMSWQQSADEHFVNYTLYIDDESGFGSPDYVYATYDVWNTSYLTGPIGANNDYFWRVIAYDWFGTSRVATQDFWYTTDTIDPSIGLDAPGDGDYEIVGSFSFAYTANDTHLANCSLWTNTTGAWALNQTNTSPETTKKGSFPLTLNDGLYVWNVHCYDLADNNATVASNYTVLVDTEVPIVNLTSPANNTYENTTNNVIFFYNVSDYMADISNCILILDGEQEGAPDYSIDEVITQNFTVYVGNGQHNWSINCTDINGWTGSSYSFNLTLNVTTEYDPPVVTPNAPANNDYVPSNTIYFNYTPDDASGIQNCSLYIDDVLNQTNETVINHEPSHFFVPGLDEVTYDWYVECYDTFSYARGVSDTWNVTVDLTDPTVVLNLPDDNEYYLFSTAYFNYTPSDTNLDNCTLYGNFTGSFVGGTTNHSPNSGVPNIFPRGLVDGLYVWNVECIDQANRSAFAAANYTTRVDANAPLFVNHSLSPSNASPYLFGQNYSINMTLVEKYPDSVFIEHNFTGVLTNYSLNATVDNIFSYEYANLSVGRYQYRWWANDSVSRVNSSQVFVYDVARAASTINLLLNGSDGNISVTEENVLNLTGQLIFPTFGVVELYINGVLRASNQLEVINITSLSFPGTYNITAVYQATQNFSFSSETHFVIVNDTQPPVVTPISPDPEAVIGSSTVVFYYNVTDDSSIVNCSLYLNDSLHDTDFTITKNVTQTFITTLADDAYGWEIWCYDADNNLGMSEKRNFTVQETTAIFVNLTSDNTTYEEGEYAFFRTETEDEFGNPLNTNLTTDIILGNTSLGWWNTSWSKRRALPVSQDKDFDRNATVVVNVTGLGSITSCANELRVVRNYSAYHVVVDAEILDGDDTTWCQIKFNAFIPANAVNTSAYYVYYDNPSASNPGATVDTIRPEVQHDAITSSATTIVDSISQVDTSHSILFFSSLSGSSNPNAGMFTGVLTPTQVQFTRGVSSTGTIAYQVLEHPYIDVQRSEVAFSTTETIKNITIDEVNLNNSFVVVSSRTDSSTAGQQYMGWVSARLVGNSTVRLQRAASGSSAAAAYQVVDWTGARVQNGTALFSGVGSLSIDIPISSVNLSRSFVILSRRTSSGATGINDQHVRGSLTSTTNLHLERNDDDGVMTISWFVIELPEATVQQDNTFIDGSVDNDVDVSLSAVNMSRSFHVVSWENTGNGQTFTNSYLLSNLTSSTTLRLLKQTTAQDPTVDSFVVELPLSFGNASVAEEEEHIARNTGETGLDGVLSWVWSTNNQAYGNYSAVAVASRSSFLDGSDPTYFEITPDVTPPNITLMIPRNATENSSSTIIFEYLPFDWHLVNCSLWHNGSGVWREAKADPTPVNNETNGFADALTEGFFAWNVWCIDEDDNSGWAPLNYTFRVEGLGPTIELLAPEDDAVLDATTVPFSYNATDPRGVSQCGLYIDGLLNETDYQVVPGADTITAYGLVEGSHNWSLSCTDNASAVSSSETRNVSIDLSDPSVFNLLSPTNGTVNQELNVTLSWEQSFDANFDNYTVQLALFPDFADIVATYYSLSTSLTSVDVTFEPGKTYYWRVLAYDRVGHVRQSTQDFVYTTDYAAPRVGLVSPGPNAYENDGNISFVFQVLDLNVSSCSLYTNNSGSWVVEAVNNSVQYGLNTFWITVLNNGTMLWNVECVDSLGSSAFAPENRTVFIGPGVAYLSNQTIPTNLTVAPVPPSVEQVALDSQIALLAGTTTPVNCTTRVFDNNGAVTLVNVNASMRRTGQPSVQDNNFFYVNDSCACTQYNLTHSDCVCSFNLWYYANYGDWICRVTVVDDTGLQDFSTDTESVQSLLALLIEEQYIDYGNLSMGEISDEQNVTVVNYGNRNIDVSLYGYGNQSGDDNALVCDAGSVPVSYERFSVSQGTPFASMTPISGDPFSPSTADLSLAQRTDDTQNSTDAIYWALEIPAGAAGLCNGTIVFEAEVDT